MKNYYQTNSDKFGWGPNSTLAQYKVNEISSLLSGKKILDVGCGPGHLVNQLCLTGYNSTGLDITESFIRFAKKNYQGHYIIGDANELPFSNQEFDTVLVRNVLEHMTDDKKVLRECLRVGKRVIIVVPNRTSRKLLKRGLIFSHYQDKTHLRNYTRQSLRKLISISNGKIISIKKSEYLPNKSIVFELLSGNNIIKRIFIKLLFIIFQPKKYNLELIAIIKP